MPPALRLRQSPCSVGRPVALATARGLHNRAHIARQARGSCSRCRRGTPPNLCCRLRHCRIARGLAKMRTRKGSAQRKRLAPVTLGIVDGKSLGARQLAQRLVGFQQRDSSDRLLMDDVIRRVGRALQNMHSARLATKMQSSKRGENLWAINP